MRSSGRWAGLDTLRAVAILSVMAYHLRPFLPSAFEAADRFGWTGVDLFFVLSGFLIGGQLFTRVSRGLPVGVGDFYRRRAFRILPAYLVVVALYLWVPVWREHEGLAPAWKLLTFTYNLVMLYPQEIAFSHSWSLCIEEQFYLTLPLLVWWFVRRRAGAAVVAALLLAVVAAGAVVRWEMLQHVFLPAGDEAGHAFMRRIYYPTYSRLDGLVVGLALAAVRVFRPGWWQRAEPWGGSLLLAGLAVLAAAFWALDWQYPSPERTVGVVLGFPLLAVGFGCLVAAAVARHGLLRRRVPGAEFVATLAFSLYLTHKGAAHVARVLWPALAGGAGWWWAGLMFAVCLAVALLLHFAVERPFLALRERGAGANARLDPGI